MARRFFPLALAIGALGAVAPCAGAGTVVPDQVYAPNGQTLDLCLPAPGSKPTSTVVVFIHGGGFVEGDKRDMRGLCELYARAGYVSASVGYRLSGVASHPAQVDDVEAALRWIAEHVRPFERDTRALVLVGYSAGGTLALLARHERVAARVSVAGPTDLAALIADAKGGRLERDLRAFLGSAPPQAASPIAREGLAADPVFLIHGRDDAIVPVAQSVALAQKLEGEGGKVLLRVFDGIGHDILLRGPQLPQLLDEVRRYVDAVEAAP